MLAAGLPRPDGAPHLAQHFEKNAGCSKPFAGDLSLRRVLAAVRINCGNDTCDQEQPRTHDKQPGKHVFVCLRATACEPLAFPSDQYPLKSAPCCGLPSPCCG